MHPLSLFRNFKEVGIFVFGLIFIAILNLSISYHSFLEFKKSPYFEGEILSVNYKENKNNKPYFSFVIDAGSFKIFSTRWGANMPYRGRVSFSIIKEKVSFVDFLKGSFYAPTYAFSQLHVDGFKSSIKEKIEQNHQSEKLESLFLALFLATPVNQELRGDVNRFGVSHLVAISGFHLGVIMLVGYFLLSPIYKFFQSRYFPYRNLKVDLSIFLLIMAFAYLCLIDFAPSFLRAFAFSLIAFIFLSLHVKLLSFQTLYITLLTLIALSPQLFFHIGFWFSICGVFYIFLYLHWFEKSFNKVVHVLFLNIYVFLCINPIVHFFFPTTSFLQLLCIPLSVVFVVFYPVMMALHVVGFGGIFDGYLYEFLSFKASEWEYFTPFWLLCTYLILSLVAIRFKVVAVILIFFGIIPFCVG